MNKNVKQVYLTPAVQVKVVAVENGFFTSQAFYTEEIGDNVVLGLN